MDRWKPAVEVSAREQRLLKLAGKSGKLFVFLREYRHELFDDAFRGELEEMYVTDVRSVVRGDLNSRRSQCGANTEALRISPEGLELPLWS